MINLFWIGYNPRKEKKQMDEETLPVTFLHSEQCEAKVMDSSEVDFAREHDTFIQGTGDSDTI